MIKYIFLLFPLLVFSQYEEINKEIKIENTKYTIKDVRYYKDARGLYKEKYILEGNGKDVNGDGKIERKTIICRMIKTINEV
jgi:hypothetical protein